MEELPKCIPGTWECKVDRSCDMFLVFYRNKNQAAAYSVGLVELSHSRDDIETLEIILRNISGRIVSPRDIKKITMERLLT